jgi:transaldolase
MKKFNIDRRLEPVIAIGGGVCLDVVGLAASMFRRRTPYIRVPTTSLSYVDASVGAKNGCNFCGSKNRLGTYVPPVAALLDSSFFRTQDTRDISNSLGEMCKMGIMKSAELLQLLEQHGPRLIAEKFAPRDKDDGVPGRVLQISIETMLEELAPNLWEHCLDRLVDFGHAVGQNLEMTALGTDVELMHGEAVATDMSYMTVLSNTLGELSDTDRDRILRILNTCGLPTHHPMLTRAFFKEAMEDRVQNSMGMRLPLPVGFGKARMFNDVTSEQFEKAFVLWEKLTSQTTISVRSPVSNAAPRFVPGVKSYFTFPPAPNALMVDIFMREKGIDTAGISAFEHFIDLPSLENRNEQCLKMNPQGSLPWFVLDDDTVVAETIAMCEYVEEVMPEPCLVGASAKERGVVRQWQRRMEEHYCYPAFYGHRSWTCSSDCPDDHFMKNFFAQRLNEHHGAALLPESWKDLCRWARNKMVWLEKVKQESPSAFIAGDKFTVVDVQVYVTLWFFSEAFPHPPQRILQDLQGQLPWVQRWFDAVHNRPACQAAREYREANMNSNPTAQSNSTDQPMNTLAQLKNNTVIVADTGDLDSIKVCKPTDATTNPSLILNAARMPQYSHLLDEAVDWAMKQSASDADKVALMVDRCCVNFGAEILKEIPGYISTEVDASLSYDVEATIRRAEGIIAMYAEKGVSKDRVLIKLAATWEGVKAAEELESRGIRCNLTLLFGFSQAVICAEAGVTLISPFVGRISDWYKKELKVDGFKPSDDPGCKSVKRIYNYYKKHGYNTIVMGASFRNLGQLLELSGVDRLTIDPKFLKQLAESEAECEAKLSVGSAQLSSEDASKLELNEEQFRQQLAADRMASEKLTEGIEKFVADKDKLELILKDLLTQRRSSSQPQIKLSTPTFRVDGRSFIVTGSTSGLGREIARCLARQGARGVLIHGTSMQRGAEVVESIKKECPECKVVFQAADLHDAKQCASLVPAAEQAFGTIDGLVNSAATCFPRGTLEDTSLELWDGMFHLNTRAVFLVTQAVAQHMKHHKVQGSIVNIASIAAQGGAPWITAYSASKAAVVSMTKTNAFELRPHAIRVNAINMGWCLTDKEMQGQNSWKGEDWLTKAEQQHPMGRLMRPVDVAGTVGHLLSDAATMLTGAIIDFAPEQITGTYA